jgi:hypothetical protein
MESIEILFFLLAIGAQVLQTKKYLKNKLKKKVMAGYILFYKWFKDMMIMLII